MLWFGRPPVRREGFAVLRWWPDGVHDLLAFSATPTRPQQLLERWQRRGKYDPQAPIGWSVVPATRAQVRDHDPDGCRRTDCAGADRISLAGGAR